MPKKLYTHCVYITLRLDFFCFDDGDKFFGWFKGWDEMFGDDDGGVFGNVASGFWGSLFYLEGTKAPEVYILVLGHAGLNCFHQGFDGFYDLDFFDTGFPGDFCC
jgi:hypothetical protein